MWWLYDIALLLGFLLLYIPTSFLRGKYHPGMWSRLGRVPELPADRPVLWLHAVSVGEALVASAVYEQFTAQHPEWRCIISTVTDTGRQVVERFLRDGDHHLFLPLDTRCLMTSAMRRLRPRLIVMIETELWPNWLCAAQAARVPVVLVNGRISDRSFQRYRQWAWAFRDALPAIGRCVAQTSIDAKRFETIGIPADRISIGGNLKFDMALAQCATAADVTAIRQRCGLTDTIPVMVGGSTHAGEEEVLLETFHQLTVHLPSLRLMMAPRHPERCDTVSALIQRAGYSVARWSQLPGTAQHDAPVVLIDTVGELARIYGVATVVFMGGSLIPHGGQNPLEPAILQKPMVMGPYYENFRSVVEQLLHAQACRIARNGQELTRILREILIHPALQGAMGQAAGLVVKANTGAVQRALQAITETLAHSRS